MTADADRTDHDMGSAMTMVAAVGISRPVGAHRQLAQLDLLDQVMPGFSSLVRHLSRRLTVIMLVCPMRKERIDKRIRRPGYAVEQQRQDNKHRYVFTFTHWSIRSATRLVS